ncbi:YciI family protein [Nocardioides sp. CFH 31398]|uniref:YciI family protein n=1 Tax=Nocardioides sp. CFH 31398 TaxID=2919579 RepID=UPI001F06EE7F|nr:YciI family protein [Nocardioides sp. CFH 31398]MCH1867657.1 YciI family protein [Nocardioides sp. CFH 31398]
MTTTYTVLLSGDADAWEGADDAARAETYAAHGRFAAALAERGHTIVGGAELTHPRGARALRRRGDGVVRTDGPYAETAEQLTGFYLVASDDLEDLLACAELLLDGDGGIEVRAARTATDGEA